MLKFLNVLIKLGRVVVEIVCPFLRVEILSKHDRNLLSKCTWVLILSIPTSAHAADFLADAGFLPPFVMAWSTAHIFIIAASLLSLTFGKLDIEYKYDTRPFVKVGMGVLWGLVVALWIDNSSPPSGWAILCGVINAIFATPVLYGIGLYLYEVDKVQKIFGFFADKFVGKGDQR